MTRRSKKECLFCKPWISRLHRTHLPPTNSTGERQGGDSGSALLFPLTTRMRQALQQLRLGLVNQHSTAQHSTAAAAITQPVEVESTK